jgi:regulator of replication initiation timing
VRRDGSPIVDWDGYVEVFYGVKFPEEFNDSFHLVAYIDDEIKLPNNPLNGEAYILRADKNNAGELYIWNSTIEDWVVQPAIYGFSLYEEDDTKQAGIINSLINPKYFRQSGNIVYRDLVFIKGLRLAVETMEAPDTTFDLIELSPRLRADMSKYVESYSFVKSIANEASGLPVGGLLASNGDVTILNDDGAFTINNELRFVDDIDSFNTPRIGSLVAKYLKPNIKFIFYEAVLNVNGYNKYIPMKSLYAENFTGTSGGQSELSIPLRDFFFRLESLRAPSMFFTNVSLTSAVAMLLDNIGFSNYVFKGFDEIQFGDLSSEQINAKINELQQRINELRNRNNFLQQELEKLKISLANDFFTDIAREALQNRIKQFEIAIKNNQSEINSFLQIINNLKNPQSFLQSIKDPVIPFFFVNPDASVAQALIDLAISCQAAMFFDEYNRLVVMPKEYILPNEGERSSDIVLYGQVTQENEQTTSLPNIVNIQNAETQVFNDGVIQYNIRYIQREVTTIPQIDYLDQDKVYGYKPVLLWEVGESQELKTTNEETKSQAGYALGAAPLNSDLSDEIPVVENNTIINNIIDLGDNVYWLPRFQGYLFANGEIIRYDAIEYNISGTGIVWMTSNQQYQQYFAKLPFNGKIYPTGNVRIFVEPNYIEYEGAEQTDNLPQNVRFQNGPVKRHGRGQFGTEIVAHSAGLPPYWSNNNNVRGCRMVSSFIFSTTPTENITYPAFSVSGSAIGVDNILAQRSTRNGIIKNFLRQSYPTDDIVKTLQSTQSGTIQSSALVFAGPQEFPTDIPKRDFISYVYKKLDAPYKHVGARIRIIGGLKNNDKIQSPLNAATYFNVEARSARDSINLDGGSAGIGIGVNPSTNYGYFFEICALTADNLEQYRDVDQETGAVNKVLHNIIFYKTVRNNETGEAIPYKLWGGTAKIIVDEGLFVGMDRIVIEESPKVYDLAVEYEDVAPGGPRKFYLYINNTQIAIVDDPLPLPEYSNLALFVRGGSEAMFEHVYALQNLMARNTGETVFNQIADAFSLDKVTSIEALRKYSMSGFIKSAYLSGISPQHSPNFKMYFEEFGTIMRECVYFNIRYDQAYPALLAQPAPTFGQERGYSISGFYAGSYGAEFLIFNNNDTFVELDETTGNYLRIIGVTFTQNISQELTVDDFFKERSSLSNPFVVDGLIRSPIAQQKVFDDIKSSRKKHGKREFSFNPAYIQSTDDANEMMEWLINKTLKNRLMLDVEIFGTPQLQLGDIISMNYDLPEGVKFVDPNKQFVVYSIQQNKSFTELTTNLRVVEI